MVLVYMNCLELESPASEETSTEEIEDDCKFSYFCWSLYGMQASTLPRLPLSNTIFHNGDRNGKVIGNPYPGRDHHRKLITSKGSPPLHAYRVWSTSVSAFVSYPPHRQTDRHSDRILLQPWWSNVIYSQRRRRGFVCRRLCL